MIANHKQKKSSVNFALEEKFSKFVCLLEIIFRNKNQVWKIKIKNLFGTTTTTWKSNGGATAEAYIFFFILQKSNRNFPATNASSQIKLKNTVFLP